MLLAWISRVAEACSGLADLNGFEAWMDGAIDVPTDTRILVSGGPAFAFTLTRLDTLEHLPTTEEAAVLSVSELGTRFAAYTPQSELAPGTTYRADVSDAHGTAFSTTFTTGDGPTDPSLPPPALQDLDATDWEPFEGFGCTVGSPIVARTVEGSVPLPDGLPVGTHLALRSASGLAQFDFVSVATHGDVNVEHNQGQHEGSSSRTWRRGSGLGVHSAVRNVPELRSPPRPPE